VGFKPTYGAISRWGVISYAHSLDTVGIFSRDVPAAESIFGALNEYDKRDPTSLLPSIRKRFTEPSSTVNKFTFGVPREFNLPSLHPAMSKAWSVAISKLQSQGCTVETIGLPRTKEALSAYYVIATAEAASNLARYDGVRYGYHNTSEGYQDGLFSARAQGFGDEVRRRILLGNYTLSARFDLNCQANERAFESYFIQAQRVRRLIQYSFDDVFKTKNSLHNSKSTSSNQPKCDIIFCPTAVGPAPALSSIAAMKPVETYVNDVFTVPASLAGLPAISIPVQIDGHFLGLQLIGQVGTDTMVLQAAKQLEELLQA
jgi:aspartyl-tRNA(Asn)/glutamyl-tRNA(Gln) amidotransferase subunit A